MGTSPVDSRKPESLDEIVSRSAAVLAEQIQAAAAWAQSEMDLQVEVAAALKEFGKRAQIKLEGHHNVTVATGRPDSVYGSVIVEYKNPGTLSATKDATPNKAVIDQLKKRFYDMRREENRKWNSMFGVGTDGKYFIFLRFRDDKWTDQEPLEINRYSAERFLWALYNLGQKGKPYQPEYLHGDFGSESSVAQEGVRALYEEILATDNPKAEVFFSQWKILFGEVCGYDVENLSDKLKKLAEFYVVKGKPQPAPLLFAVHTYYAILIKLLAAEIVSFFNPWMPRQVEKLQSAITSTKLRRELQELEHGGIFHQMGITNFLEGDLFSWYLEVWTDPVQALVRKMISKLDEYNPGTFSEDPAQSRDLLKKLYQQLFPKSVRHDLGEYYTPDWLAEHVLNELGYEGDPDKRLLDPACGSGTFLVMAINRIRRWYDLNREKCAYDDGELLRKILANVVGFDLNPLAVMAARTNYLVAIKDLVRHVDHVELPVYLCDSIMTPAEYGDLFTGSHGTVAKVPCSAMKPPHLLVPKEIAKSPKEVAKYAEILEHCVKNAYAPDEFLSRCRDEGLNITANDAHIDLYKELVKLDKANKNGIWARIIKNNFAPLFLGTVDYVAGNPPWITWENLPTDYRKDTYRIFEGYNLFPHTGMRARMAGANVDLSIAMTYVAADRFLQPGGCLGFVITQSVFQSSGGDGFRFFKVGDKGLRVKRVCDMVSLKPFEGATNRTCTFVFEIGKETRYPVPYEIWKPKSGPIDIDSTLDAVRKVTSVVLAEASPVKPEVPNSPWQINAGKMEASALNKVAGSSSYIARKGVSTSANGVYWVEFLDKGGGKTFVVRNHTKGAKLKIEEQTFRVESERLYPLLRGRDCTKWLSKPELFIVFPHERGHGIHAIPEATLKSHFPLAYEHLRKHRALLSKRKEYTKFLEPQGDPFYSLYPVREYTFADYKVAFREISTRIEAVVIHQAPLPDGRLQMVVPDHKLVIIPCSTDEEAHYLCALVNSAPFGHFAMAYSVGTQISTHLLRNARIPTFDSHNRVHRDLAKLSLRCHKAASDENLDSVGLIEDSINKAAAELWGLTGHELKATQGVQAETGKSRSTSREDD
jgi:hypothetical protein